MPIIDDLAKGMADRAGGAIAGMTNLISDSTDTVLMRRLRVSYPKLAMEEVLAIRDSLGHEHAEARPCKTCRMMAQQEFDLAED